MMTPGIECPWFARILSPDHRLFRVSKSFLSRTYFARIPSRQTAYPRGKTCSSFICAVNRIFPLIISCSIRHPLSRGKTRVTAFFSFYKTDPNSDQFILSFFGKGVNHRRFSAFLLCFCRRLFIIRGQYRMFRPPGDASGGGGYGYRFTWT